MKRIQITLKIPLLEGKTTRIMARLYHFISTDGRPFYGHASKYDHNLGVYIMHMYDQRTGQLSGDVIHAFPEDIYWGRTDTYSTARAPRGFTEEEQLEFAQGSLESEQLPFDDQGIMEGFSSRSEQRRAGAQWKTVYPELVNLQDTMKRGELDRRSGKHRDIKDFSLFRNGNGA